MRIFVGLAVCCALLFVGCGSNSDAESSQGAQQAAHAAERHEGREKRRLIRQARRAEAARARRRAVRRQAKREAARSRARRAAARAEAEERERIEAEEVEEAEAVASECDPNYEGACLDPYAADYDCEGGSGDGPEYTGPVVVVGDDHYGLDADGDGYGCE